MVDAVGGVAKIVGVALKIKEAANTVHQNKKDCHHIKSRVDILSKTFSHHENNTELAEDSAVMAALEALDGILAEALEVITKCQKERSIICIYYTAGNLSRRLSKVEQRISYVSSDAMLTIMSYQLLRKSQEGAPQPSPQISIQNHDEANKQDMTQTSQSNSPSEPMCVAAVTQIPERRSDVHGQHTPGRSRMRQSNQGYNPEEDVTVPPFGEWDAGEPASGEKYTGIFNRVRDDKLSPDSSCRQQSSGNHREENKVEQVGRILRQFFGTILGGHRQDASHHSSPGSSPASEMRGEPCSLVHRIAEVARNIKEAVETVLHSRDDCVEIAELVHKVHTLMSLLEGKNMLDEPAMRRTLEKLLATFRRAHTLVIACQRRGFAIVWLSSAPGRLSTQLHEVMDQIASTIADMTAIVLT